VNLADQLNVHEMLKALRRRRDDVNIAISAMMKLLRDTSDDTTGRPRFGRAETLPTPKIRNLKRRNPGAEGTGR
jgi:hypothetical protein